MDLSTWTLFGLIVLLALNQAVVRFEALARQPVVFWGINLVDGVAGVAVLIFGLPGFGHIPPVRFVVGLLFLLHVAQNLKVRADQQAEARKQQRDAEREARRASWEEEEGEDPG